jgi:sRNA-binding protein
MTDTDHTAAAKKHADETRKKLKEDRDAREKASKERAKTAGDTKPTPTQEENDLAASGVYIEEHEDDGSGPDPNAPATKDKQMAADKPGGYQTRTASAKA